VCVVVCEQETVGRVCNKVLSDNGVSKDERHRRAQGTHLVHLPIHLTGSVEKPMLQPRAHL
jgi:hypothetical protein